ncbi:hypothetical protein A2692_02880, partial [Candidatus Woesebacteria bacterium RIFCSPHIGHO2_01_FULL_39_95]
MAAENLELKERIDNNLRYPLIGVVGPMGSGKSTLSELMVQLWNVPDYPVRKCEELYEENPFLSDFYRDPKRYSFSCQTFFLESKARQLTKIMPNLSQGSIIVDPALEMDRIFARTQASVGWMTDAELAMYENLYDLLIEERGIIDPDLYLVVNASPDVIRQRVKERGREFELKILRDRPDYFDNLCYQVADFAKNSPKAPVINIDSQRLNYVSTPYGRWNAVNEVMVWSSYYFRRDGSCGSDGSKLIL